MEKRLLERFFLNECSKSERLYVIEWMLDSSNDRLLKTWMLEHWDLLSYYDTGEVPDVNKIWENLQRSIREEYSTRIQHPPHHTRQRKLIRIVLASCAVAATVLLIFFTPSLFKVSKDKESSETRVSENLVRQKNATRDIQVIKLKDGSSIDLMPDAVIYYPSTFSKDSREVYLEGEAFFEIARNARHPFHVYTGNLVTKVLGTSFLVRAFPNAKTIEVSVRTGEVLVFEKDYDQERISNHSVLLTPNQKTIFSIESKNFKTSLVDKPIPIPGGNKESDGQIADDFDFEEMSIKNVIQTIKSYYDIDVVVEDEALYKCTFRGNVSGLSLYEKLDVICEAIDANYQVVGTKILMRGSGCK